MATFLLHWERFGQVTDDPQELENWHDRYKVFSGPLHKTRQQARDFIDVIKFRPEYGKTRRYKIYKFIEAIE